MKKLIVLYIFTCFLTPVHVIAQETTLSISPAVTEILLSPNTPVSQTIYLKTNGIALSVTPELHLVTASDDSGHTTLSPSAVDPASLPLSVSSSIPLSTPLQTQGDDLALTLTFTAPASDTPTDIYLALVFRTNPTISTPSNSLSSPAISALLFISVVPTSTLPLDLSLSQFDPPMILDPLASLSLAPIITNQTSSMVRLYGTFTVASPRNLELVNVELFPHLILGKSTRKIQAKLNDTPAPLTYTPHWYQLGPHTFTLTLTTEGGTKIVESSKIVWFFPWKITFVFLLIILFLTLTIRHFYPRLKMV